jgi:hypothetical protein
MKGETAMNNINIEEIREALQDARGECSEVQSKVSDLNDSASDVKSYAEDADTAAYEAEDKVKQALDMLDGWIEDREEAIDPDEAREFLQSTINTVDQAMSMLTVIRSNCFNKARDWGLSVKGE